MLCRKLLLCLNERIGLERQMAELSLLIDAVSQIDEPFLLSIVGEFNSGKSTVINTLLGKRYLNEVVVRTTNEITFLCYSKSDSEEQQRMTGIQMVNIYATCQFKFLKSCNYPFYVNFLDVHNLTRSLHSNFCHLNIVDTPGTNVILQRQQRFTEEFVPHGVLLLFVISAD
ncbi:hypothetical protein NC652_005569 [Populus alba x Populus x berolinensis]|nr:hypothetical protein NC652_005569 [Populus alba x Populus x berolinensis]